MTARVRAFAARLPAVRLPALTIAPWACAAGAAASLVLRPPAPVALAAGGALGLALLAARQRPVAVAAVVASAGLALGVVRLDALAADPLGGAVGRSIDATATVTGDWRGTPPRWGAEARLAPRGDRVFLRLVAARPPPRGAILAVSGDLRRPDPPRNGYDEAALLARRGIRVVLEAERWRPVGRRGGVAGVLDRIRQASVEAYGRRRPRRRGRRCSAGWCWARTRACRGRPGTTSAPPAWPICSRSRARTSRCSRCWCWCWRGWPGWAARRRSG